MAVLKKSVVVVLALAIASAGFAANAETTYPANSAAKLAVNGTANIMPMRQYFKRLFERNPGDELLDVYSPYQDTCYNYLRMIKLFSEGLRYYDGYWQKVDPKYVSTLNAKAVGRDMALPNYELHVAFLDYDYCFGSGLRIDTMRGDVKRDGSSGTFYFYYQGELRLRFDAYNVKTDSAFYIAVPEPDTDKQYYSIACTFGTSQVKIAQKYVAYSKMPGSFYSAQPVWSKLISGCESELQATKSSAKLLVGKKIAAKYNY